MGDDRRILTVPDEISESDTYALTGNEYVSLPMISRRTGALLSANVLHMGCKGLLEFSGSPLSQPVVLSGGKQQQLSLTGMEYEAHFLPRFAGVAAGLEVSATYLAPPGFKGFVLLLSATNPGQAAVTAGLGITGEIRSVTQTIFTRRELNGGRRFFANSWSQALIYEASPGLPAAALAIRAEGACTLAADPQTSWSRDGGGDVPPGRPCRYTLCQEVTVVPGATVHRAFYFGLGVEADGAGLNAVDLARHGWEQLLAQSRNWLEQRARPAPTRALAGQLNRNLFFAIFFAAGRTIDTEELVLCTSRSPRYYVSAAHWSRDSLLWAFPAVLAADAELARLHLRAAFRLYTRNPGIHALYVDGTVLYPGFELDELCAFVIALRRYLAATGDGGILREPEVRTGLERVSAEMKRRQDPGTGLASTFLISSDDPAHHPYVTYANALLSLSYRCLGEVLGRPEYEQEASRIRSAIYERLVVQGPFGPQFCWSADLAGGYILYDEPPGSLELLTHYGFTTAADPVYANTVAWIYSSHNPFYQPSGRYATPTCPHVSHPWVLSLANGLLAGRELLAMVAQAPMDAGFACETIDRETGVVRTGAGFATGAGFLAYAIDQALDGKGR